MSEADERSFDSQIASLEIRSALMYLVKGVPECDRENVVQDIILAALRERAKFNPALATLKTWISGIGKNVVGSYVRAKNAQKRIASDDPADFGGDRNAEPVRKISELRGLVDNASLSEKEKKAIFPEQNHNQKASASTKHRATQKLKQLRSDDEFHDNCEYPNAPECAYGRIKPDEHTTTLLYDFSRKTSWFVEAVNRWRKTPQWKDVQSDLQSKRTLRRYPLNIPPSDWPGDLHRYYRQVNERSPKLRRQFAAAIEIALAFPEWPAAGFCSLDPLYRRSRLQEFGWVFEEEPFWEISDADYEIFTDGGEIQMPGSSASSQLSRFLEMINQAPRNGSDSYNSVHLIRIDWRYPAKTLVRSFKKWAATQPKQDTAKIQSAGRPRTRLLLGYAFDRLTNEFGMNAFTALSWLKKNYGSRVPTSPETLRRAAARARNSLRNVLPPPTEIGL
jgi:DNA-directed RNA polymerase specialized sigma24 family protein